MTETNGVLWDCPKCGQSIYFPNLLARRLAEQAGGCQGCRAKAMFEKNPALINLFLEFWGRTSPPQSASWMGAVAVIA